MTSSPILLGHDLVTIRRIANFYAVRVKMEKEEEMYLDNKKRKEMYLDLYNISPATKGGQCLRDSVLYMYLAQSVF